MNPSESSLNTLFYRAAEVVLLNVQATNWQTHNFSKLFRQKPPSEFHLYGEYPGPANRKRRGKLT